MTSFKFATGKAHGRLDFLGGVADYSGARVLQKTISNFTEAKITILEDPSFSFFSSEEESFECPVRNLKDCFAPSTSLIDAKQRFEELKLPTWSRYVLGCLLVLKQKYAFELAVGYNFKIRSNIPQSMGLGSSAALEIAILRALCKLHSVKSSSVELAHVGQIVENEIIGAPCGLMDQLTAIQEHSDEITPILCQPDIIEPSIRLPRGSSIVGWASGISHDHTSGAYARVRTATMMAKEILRQELNLEVQNVIDIPLKKFEAHAKALIPKEMSGEVFESKYGRLPQSETLHPKETYLLNASLGFPLREHQRSTFTKDLIANVSEENHHETLQRIGKLMIESNDDYEAIGLGSTETQDMVNSLMKLGPTQGIFGARVSGGGARGTVVILIEDSARTTVETLSKEMASSELTRIPLVY